MFRGDRINVSENRSVLHVALRMPREASLIVDGVDVVKQVHEVLDRMAAFAQRVRSGEWKGHTGKPIRNVVNIGIGGSDLGPVMAYEALRSLHAARPDVPLRLQRRRNGFRRGDARPDAEETLFIVSSKTFTTLETMTNAKSAREWALAQLGDESAIAKHFVAVSTNAQLVRSSGSTRPTCSASGTGWAGATRWTRRSACRRCWRSARSSSRRCSAAFTRSTSTSARAAGAESAGADGPAGVWYGDFFGSQSIGVMPYEQYLKRFPAYLQQLTMESNGKHVTLTAARRLRDGRGLLGRAGNQRPAQLLPAASPGHEADPRRPDRLRQEHQPAARPPRHPLLERVRAGAGAGVRQDRGGGARRGHAGGGVPHRVMEGNRPTNVLLAEKLTPAILGSLVALYEHSVFTQGAIWDIDSFDQWGVELGKALAKAIIPELESESEPQLEHDSSTNALIRRYRELKARPGAWRTGRRSGWCWRTWTARWSPRRRPSPSARSQRSVACARRGSSSR